MFKTAGKERPKLKCPELQDDEFEVLRNELQDFKTQLKAIGNELPQLKANVKSLCSPFEGALRRIAVVRVVALTVVQPNSPTLCVCRVPLVRTDLNQHVVELYDWDAPGSSERAVRMETATGACS